MFDLGYKFGRFKIVSIEEDTYTSQCDCGEYYEHDKKYIVSTKEKAKCGSCFKRRRNYYKKINHNAFDDLTDPETLYWVGMLYADGNVNIEKKVVHLKLIDEEHIAKFKQFLKSEHKISYFDNSRYNQNHKDSYSLNFTSVRIANQMETLGFTTRKSKIIKPHEKLKGSRHFWRGVIDGDGSIYTDVNNSLKLYICGNLYTCNEFSSYVESHFNISGNPRYDSGNYRITYSNSKACKILNHVYKYENEIHLDRKYYKFKAYFNSMTEKKIINYNKISKTSWKPIVP